jgi:hypothetical protein
MRRNLRKEKIIPNSSQSKVFDTHRDAGTQPTEEHDHNGGPDGFLHQKRCIERFEKFIKHPVGSLVLIVFLITSQAAEHVVSTKKKASVIIRENVVERANSPVGVLSHRIESQKADETRDL